MAALAHLVALLAPPACAACRTQLAAADRMVCSACLRALPWLGPCCPRCALPAHERCPAEAAAFSAAWSPLAYAGSARELMRALKFRGALPLAGFMAAQIAVNLPAELREADAVVPVPAHRGRRRRRGFDPAGLLAAGVAERLALPVWSGLARGGGRSQIGTGRAERRSLGRLALTAAGRPPPRLLLVDDVHTTGATLDACAATLRAAGAQWVAAVTYARTL